ncbi:glycosyltransferase family 2 protein [Bifidobacterium animalis]|uniref:glycosyltransferase family 2 protein n=1 Tax=Bifidobacterium animalis TaxID=28025 RepID=UPI001D01605C|nr:glycosyltransferase family 2 protein [Bifidobacterium animalis]MCB5628885.1 glycosyltransferase family 2 protein [Bifidobacterium animalis]
MNDTTARQNLFAGIVTFNPDIELLRKNIEAICAQVDLVIIVDNGSRNLEDIRPLADAHHCKLIPNAQNEGIATALNQIALAGKGDGYSWMLTLDQDSECPPDFCSTLSQFFSMNSRIAIVAPVIQDRDRGIIGHKPAGTYGEVRTCITSGSCTRLSAWEKIGGFDEKLFIDSVDFDFCYRIRKTGYVIIQTREAVLEHSIGEVKKNKLLGIPYSEHSAFRYYYIPKNNIYYPLKNRLYLHALRGNARNMRNLLQVLFFEEDKKAKLKQIARGWVNGYK